MKLLDYEGLGQKGIAYSKPQIWRKVKDRSFPAPIKVGAARNAWVESEIDEWIKGRIAERDAKASLSRGKRRMNDLAVKVGLLPELISALQQAEAEARRRGLLGGTE